MRHALPAALLVVALSSVHRPAWSQVEPKAVDACEKDPTACGRREFRQGIRAYRQRKYDQAVEHFSKAQRYRPHPVVLFNLALAEARSSRLVDAAAHYEVVLADAKTPKSIRRKATLELRRLERQLTTVEVDPGAQLFVDELRAAGNSLRTTPGAHRIRVLIDGKEQLNRTLTLNPGERVRLSVNQARQVVVEPARPKQPQPAPRPPPRPRGLSPVWFWVGVGATAALGGVSVWSGLDVTSAHDDYQRDLPTLDQAEADARVDEGHAKERRTNILLGATALAAAGTAAVGVFLVDWGPAERPTGGVSVGPTGVRASGRF